MLVSWMKEINFRIKRPNCMRFLFVLAGVFCLSLTFAEPGRLRATKGKLSAEVLVTKAAPNDNRLGWGFEIDPAKKRVAGVSIRNGNKKVYIAPSAWGDLADPNTVRFETVKGATWLVIVGGDAAGSYRARLKILGEYVTERVVESGEFPEAHFERTVYGWKEPKY